LQFCHCPHLCGTLSQKEYHTLCSLLIAGLDVLWVVVILRSRRIDIRISAVLIVVVLALSASFLAVLIATVELDRMMH
jgi:hypothetical protein